MKKAFDLKAIFHPVQLTLGSCWKTILLFSLPIIVSYLLQQVYSISDAAIVGQTLTADEVAGVTDTTPLTCDAVCALHRADRRPHRARACASEPDARVDKRYAGQPRGL